MTTYASFGRRLWGFVLDVFVDLLVASIIAALVGDGRAIGPVLLWLVIHHVGLVVEGGTVGHRAAGMRIVRSSGARIDVVRSLLRAVIKFTLSGTAVGLGFLWMLDEPRRRTWHDLVGDSIVVREQRHTADVVVAPALIAAHEDVRHG